jgi:hypothetical protein
VAVGWGVDVAVAVGLGVAVAVAVAVALGVRVEVSSEVGVAVSAKVVAVGVRIKVEVEAAVTAAMATVVEVAWRAGEVLGCGSLASGVVGRGVGVAVWVGARVAGITGFWATVAGGEIAAMLSQIKPPQIKTQSSSPIIKAPARPAAL